MQPVESTLTPLDHLLFDGAMIRMGLIQGEPQHPDFRNDGPIHHPALQFQSQAVLYERQHCKFVADQNVASFFSRGEEFQRRALDPRGESSFWIAFDPKLLGNLPTDHLGAESTQGGLIEHSVFRMQLQLRHILQTDSQPIDDLWAEELGLRILAKTIEGCRPDFLAQAHSVCSRDFELAELVRELLACHYQEKLSLARIGAEVGSSPFHLARRFRRVTGTSIHSYCSKLRLREGLIRLLNGADDIAAVALDLGFSSHSHFTTQFKSAFGLPPSEFRRLQLQELGDL